MAIERVGVAQIRIARGGLTARLDLRQDIAGCLGELYDPMEKVRSPADVALELVDVTEKPPFTYVVLYAHANSNCNIQGLCGAGDGESTLIWLQLTDKLTLKARNAVIFDSCDGQKSAQVKGHDATDEVDAGFGAKDLPWTGDTLRIEVVSVTRDSPQRWHLTYERSKPDAGLGWTEEKPAVR